jgi:hypothetical protein
MINSKHHFKTNSHQFKPSDLDKIQQLTQSFSPLNQELKPCHNSSKLCKLHPLTLSSSIKQHELILTIDLQQECFGAKINASLSYD